MHSSALTARALWLLQVHTYPNSMAASGTTYIGNRFTRNYPLDAMIDNLYLSRTAVSQEECQHLAGGYMAA